MTGGGRLLATALLLIAVPAFAAPPPYGQIGKIVARRGMRDALIAILREGTGGMAGCRAYLIAKDGSDLDTIWISEAWDSRAAHDASLQSPAVRAAIGQGRPLIASIETIAETEPVDGPR